MAPQDARHHQGASLHHEVAAFRNPGRRLGRDPGPSSFSRLFSTVKTIITHLATLLTTLWSLLLVLLHRLSRPRQLALLPLWLTILCVTLPYLLIILGLLSALPLSHLTTTSTLATTTLTITVPALQAPSTCPSHPSATPATTAPGPDPDQNLSNPYLDEACRLFTRIADLTGGHPVPLDSFLETNIYHRGHRDPSSPGSSPPPFPPSSSSSMGPPAVNRLCAACYADRLSKGTRRERDGEEPGGEGLLVEVWETEDERRERIALGNAIVFFFGQAEARGFYWRVFGREEKKNGQEEREGEEEKWVERIEMVCGSRGAGRAGRGRRRGGG